ncbi:MAG: flagellar FleN [Rhodocyclales bacterium]|nr:flagellar FleN [Rhodocyclales bacterium]
MTHPSDQAAGLRAMLNHSPPEVLAIVPCGAAAMRWVARQANQRAAVGQRVLAFDEWQISGNFSDCVGVSPRFDLQQAVEGQIDVEQCVAETRPTHVGQIGLGVLSVARLAREIDGNRILQQRTLSCLLRLQASSDEWLLLARPCDLTGLSSFARAAPRLLLVVEPVERAITEAYAALKRLVRGADTLAVGISVVGPDEAQARALATRFQRVAATQLGVHVQPVTSVGEAIGLADPQSPSTEDAQGFTERLLQQAKNPIAPLAAGANRGRALVY